MAKTDSRIETDSSAGFSSDNQGYSLESERDRSLSSLEEEEDRPLVSFFIPDLSLGGAEQVTINIANGLSARGYEIDLLLSRKEGELQSQLTSEVTVIELSPSRTSIFGVAAHLPALASYLRKKRPAVLFSQMSHVNIVPLALNRLLELETAIVPTHHTGMDASTETTPKDRIVRHLYPSLYQSADQIIAVSEGIADDLTNRIPIEREDISVIHNPIQIELIQERSKEAVSHEWLTDEDKDVVLFVGRIELEKDLKTWLEAFAQVSKRNPDARAVIGGTGTKKEEILAYAGELGVAELLSMPGYLENPYKYMRRADVFLLSSRYEGLPTVLIEALACGCPVVATDSPGGTREILDDGEYGLLVPVGDSNALAEAVCRTLEDPPSSEILQDRAEDFGSELILDEYEAFIENYSSH